MKKAKALVIKQKDVLAYEEISIPKLKPYEVLFKTSACSLCTVDQRVLKGKRNYGYPFLGGHECSGTIVAIGEGVVEVKENDKAIFTSGYCNQCSLDRSNKGTQCLNKKKMPQRVTFEGSMLGGGLSEYLVIPAWQIIKMPDDVNMYHAALTEPLACCVHSLQKARVQLADTVVIIGLGIMGYFHMKLAQLRGARVIVSEMDEQRKEKARQQGAIYVIDPTKENAIEKVKELTNGAGADVVINTIPTASIWQEAISMLAPYGKLIAYSSQDSKDPIGVDFGYVHSKEIEIIGTLNPTLEDNEIATKLIRYQMIDMEEVIDAVYPFEQGEEAFEKACDPKTYRVIISYESK